MLTIFIDALSHQVAMSLYKDDASLFLGNMPQRLQAGAGYSSNLHWELFTGAQADRLNFFCDWGLKEQYSFDETPPLLHQVLQYTDRNNLFNAIIRILRRKLARTDDNIPWSQKRHFERGGTYLFSSDQPGAKTERDRLGVLDEGDYQATLAKIDQKISNGQANVFAVINELDGVGHKVGGSAPEYAVLARRILQRAQKTIQHYRRCFPMERIRLLSDHGMHDVLYCVDPTSVVLRRLGQPGRDYVYYTDSVYLRAWFRTDEAAKRFDAAISQIPAARRLGTRERARLGISNQHFADLIYVLCDGAVFSPNMFSLWVRQGPQGMHGYLSDSSWSCGFYVDNWGDSERAVITPGEIPGRAAHA
jgi:hypothetical protein